MGKHNAGLFGSSFACALTLAACSAEVNGSSNVYGFTQELEEASDAQFFSDISEYGIEEPSYLSEGILRAANESSAEIFRNELRYSERLSNNLVATRAANGGAFATLAELDGVPNTGTEFLLRLMIYAQRNNLIGRCGEGLRQTRMEQCDDGNTASSDGCSATCQNEGACVPDCNGRSCGVDPRCGASCGMCAQGTCSDAGMCMVVEPDGPRILSVSTDTNTVALGYDQRSVRGSLLVTAIVSDVDGATDIVGGELLNPANMQSYGTFQRGASGTAYEVRVSPEAFERAISDFESTAQPAQAQNLLVRFFDQAGHVADSTLSVTFQCPSRGYFGYGLCEGRCTDAQRIVYVKDADQDGYIAGGDFQKSCSPVEGYVQLADFDSCESTDTTCREIAWSQVSEWSPQFFDCDDTNASKRGAYGSGSFRSSPFYRDADRDGLGDPSNSAWKCSSNEIMNAAFRAETTTASFVENNDDCNDAESFAYGLYDLQGNALCSAVSGVLVVKNRDGLRGSVCDDSSTILTPIDNVQAAQLCRFLGFTGGTTRSVSNSRFGFVVDDLSCPAEATSLSQCTYSTTNDCDSNETVWLDCTR